MSSKTSANRSLNDLARVSEKMNVPARNDVPRMTASDVSSRRPFRARMPFSAKLNIGQSPNRFIRSSTRSAVGSVISSTTLPSARKITHSCE